MNIRRTFLVSAATLACALPLALAAQTTGSNPAGNGQTPISPPAFAFNPLAPLDVLTNFPLCTNLTQARFSVEAGASLHNGGVENELNTSFYFHTNWVATFGIQNAPTSTVIDSAKLLFGYRVAWPNAEASAQLGVQRTFTAETGTRPCFQGLLRGELSWLATSGGVFRPYVATTLLTPPTGSVFGGHLELEADAGFKLSF